MMRVRLPSGYVAELEAPGVRALLAGDGTTACVAAAAWADGGVSCGDLSQSDLYAVALWAIRHIAEDEDSVRLLRHCLHLGGLPSERIGFADRVLAFELDDLFVPEREEREPVADEAGGSRVIFTTPTPEEM
jgi:hypothetical protein